MSNRRVQSKNETAPEWNLKYAGVPNPMLTCGAGAMRHSTAWLLSTLLFGVSSRDPVIYAAVAIGVIVVGMLANVVPARRAAAVDPIRALHFE